jgi:hypothetical protein
MNTVFMFERFKVKRPFRRQNCRYENNTEIELKEIGCEDVK